MSDELKQIEVLAFCCECRVGLKLVSAIRVQIVSEDTTRYSYCLRGYLG